MENIIGNRYGKLTVVELYGKDKHHNQIYRCICDCGNEQFASAYRLKSASVKSCGCLKKEQPKKAFTTHGLRNHQLYIRWYKMKSRCNNPQDPRYKDYGGRGIRICSEWENDLRKFYEWSMTHGYSENLTLDRIDNDGDYTPDNCRWTDSYTQAANKRNNHCITLNGQTKILAEWCRIYNISPVCVVGRLHRGWSEMNALTIPPKRKKNDR